MGRIIRLRGVRSTGVGGVGMLRWGILRRRGGMSGLLGWWGGGWCGLRGEMRDRKSKDGRVVENDGERRGI